MKVGRKPNFERRMIGDRFHLTAKQEHLLTPSKIKQIEACTTEEARRLLLGVSILSTFPLVDPNVLEFTVESRPQQQGSLRNVARIGRRSRLISDNKSLVPWRKLVAWKGLQARADAGCHEIWAGFHVAVSIHVDYYFEKPKSAGQRLLHVVSPDRDKLDRALGDALQGVLWLNDAQIVEGISRKHYGTPERAEIRVERIFA